MDCIQNGSCVRIPFCSTFIFPLYFELYLIKPLEFCQQKTNSILGATASSAAGTRPQIQDVTSVKSMAYWLTRQPGFRGRSCSSLARWRAFGLYRRAGGGGQCRRHGKPSPERERDGFPDDNPAPNHFYLLDHG